MLGLVVVVPTPCPVYEPDERLPASPCEDLIVLSE